MNLEQICTGYRKKIEVTDTGMVVASVFAADGRRIGLEFFNSWFVNSPRTLVKKIGSAHKWADRMIEICSEGEVGHEY